MESTIWKKYRKQGVQVLGVSLFAQGNPAQQAKSFAQQHKLTYPILVNAKDELATRFGVESVPTNAVIGRNGRLTYLEAGYDESGLMRAVQAALKAR